MMFSSIYRKLRNICRPVFLLGAVEMLFLFHRAVSALYLSERFLSSSKQSVKKHSDSMNVRVIPAHQYRQAGLRAQ